MDGYATLCLAIHQGIDTEVVSTLTIKSNAVIRIHLPVVLT